MYDFNPYQQYNPYLNMYQNQAQPQMQQLPKQEVVKVNGEGGARAYPIGANSSALLLDESGLMVWLCTTDGGGYKTVTPLDITPHQTAPTPDYNSLESRIARLEEMFNNGNTTDTTAVKRKSNAKSDVREFAEHKAVEQHN